MRKNTCIDCGIVIDGPQGRGRPKNRCMECREAADRERVRKRSRDRRERLKKRGQHETDGPRKDQQTGRRAS